MTTELKAARRRFTNPLNRAYETTTNFFSEDYRRVIVLIFILSVIMLVFGFHLVLNNNTSEVTVKGGASEVTIMGIAGETTAKDNTWEVVGDTLIGFSVNLITSCIFLWLIEIYLKEYQRNKIKSGTGITYEQFCARAINSTNCIDIFTTYMSSVTFLDEFQTTKKLFYRDSPNHF